MSCNCPEYVGRKRSEHRPQVDRPSPKPVVENDEYAKFTLRIVRALAKRASADIDSLAALRDIHAITEDVLAEAIAACRQEGYSWSEVGQRLGITRQAAQQRYGRKMDSLSTDR